MADFTCLCRGDCECSTKSPDVVGDRGTAVDVCPTGGEQVNSNNFEMLKVLGEGGFGKVYLVRKVGGIDHQKIYAMKVQEKNTNEKKIGNLVSERQALEALRNSPFTANMQYAFQKGTKLHLVMDFVNGGDLFTHAQRAVFHEMEARLYAAELVLAIDHLHKLGIMHRDLKTENVMLDGEGHVVLIDFGLCEKFSPNDKVRKSRVFCGTTEYMAPEVVMKGSAGYGMAVDWWGVGAVTYELITGFSPFYDFNGRNRKSDFYRRIVHDKLQEHEYLTDVSYRFLAKMLTKDPSKRLGSGPAGATDIKRNPFFKGLNWKRVAAKDFDPPFCLTSKDELDVSNFSETFTSMEPVIEHGNVVEEETNMFTDYYFISPALIPACSEINDHRGNNFIAKSLKRKVKLIAEGDGILSNELESLAPPFKMHRGDIPD